ncbi:MAG: hypothetical protein JRM80_00875 [Nitrososphaerota archaeon]|nr:hypothetical protein [Nitrososphaerota archaeon]MDG7014929.1 hypothetical protein [Nitrososphaerota archaeon]WGO50888.1 MAG: hypothetical protein JRM93_02420 [Nitrososphaerota archaeon]
MPITPASDEQLRLYNIFLKLGLDVYQARALSSLSFLGPTTASRIASSSGVPRSRVYDVLGVLFRMGLVAKDESRASAVYHSVDPKDVPRILGIWLQKNYEDERKALLDLEKELLGFPLLDSKALVPELFRLVQVGASSEHETGRVISGAKREILVASQALEYYSRLKGDFAKVRGNKIKIRLILVEPSLIDQGEREIQSSVVSLFKRDHPNTEIRYSVEVPVRMSLGDAQNLPGRAVFVSQQRGVPLLLREAAVTSNGAILRMLRIYFEALWERASVTPKMGD